MRHILHVVGARPNFMKVAAVHRALDGRARQTLVHTGQHYDVRMSSIFFEQLSIPPPDINLEVGSNTHAVQTAETMIRFEPVLVDYRPDLVLVYGDVNSTVAAALVCSKLGVRVGHVEAGLRSNDWTMPEEINRVVTDRLSDMLFTPSTDANEHLSAEGVASGRVHLVGNVMIDTLVRALPLSDPRAVRAQLALSGPFALVTLHRPSNVDDDATLGALVGALSEISRQLTVVFPMHPRTRQRLAGREHSGIRVVEPLGYLEFLALQREAAVVITDSGGIQEETTYLRVPCLTLRPNTERPITERVGTNRVIGSDPDRLRAEVARILAGDLKQGCIPELWDGHAGVRIADLVLN